MKKVFITTVLILFTSVIPAAAASVGNIADSAFLTRGLLTYDRSIGLAASFEYDVINEKDYELQTGDFELTSGATRVGLFLGNHFFIYGTAGMAQYDDNKFIGTYDTGDAKVKVTMVNIDTDKGFLYGGGFSTVMYEKKVNEGVFFRIGINANYRHMDLDDRLASVTVSRYEAGGTGKVYDKYDALYNLVLNEYHGAFEISYQVDEFVPYLGFRISESIGDEKIQLIGSDVPDYKGEIKAEANTGFFVGASYHLGHICSLNVELRSRDENAISFGGVLRF